ncbi:MAG: BtrH N-terminal domain-containing protein [Ferruginibacter sp.]|nr:BtrH N-terminal domain-containing protein [Ferruginibacter sp.]
MKNEFKHLQAAHCENGVTTNLLRTIGIENMTEPMTFGIGSGLFYVLLPFLKINNGPAIAFRTMPGRIFKRTCAALDIPVFRKKFSSKESGKKFLDECLDKGQAVGCQVGVYYLTYFPKEYRFHFNAHNMIVFGKENGRYLISDPVMETVTSLSEYELERVRFAKGPFAPRGQIYYPKESRIITDEVMRNAIVKGIKNNIFHMIQIPGTVVGVNAIAHTGKKIKKWRDKLGPQKAGLYLAQLVRMQEEIGTGGGGFRYIYAAFLQQAHAYHAKDELLEISKTFTQSGDIWRNAAVQAAGIYKGRIGSQADYDVMGDYLLEIAELEKSAFRALSKIKWNS